ncbi:hypothetical protein AAMO2058_001282200 [Amorphochlora amoebiformis]
MASVARAMMIQRPFSRFVRNPTRGISRMRAIVVDSIMRRPKPDALKIANYDTPEVRPNDVLIKVRCDTLYHKHLIKHKLNVRVVGKR